jgi:hypothetical protein
MKNMGDPKQDEPNQDEMIDIADILMGDDPEPEDGWRAFDEQGRRIPRKVGEPLPVPKTSGRPEPPPPGLGDISKFISDGSDIRVGSDVEPNEKATEKPRGIPPGVGDYSKFVSDGSDIRTFKIDR